MQRVNYEKMNAYAFKMWYVYIQFQSNFNFFYTEIHTFYSSH